ncbi:MAG: hypothetical protein K9L28_00910 [Synergistales bacterium]|nr:hypothetical protein [Synergistales bacterium]
MNKTPLDIQVLLFVGPAGTGKSQRAQVVARNLDVDIIIDDGLVIRKGQIVCGKSAKTEHNQVRAIRRALFQFEDHREEVYGYLAASAPCRLMIVATSAGMAQRILRQLALPRERQVIRIEEVATTEEIERAQVDRREKRQHVIPVSYVQVRRNFAGKLVGKLKVFWHRDQHQGEKTVVRPPFSFLGELNIDPDAIGVIVKTICLRSHQVEDVPEVKVREIEKAMIDIEVHLVLSLQGSTLVERALFLKQRVHSSLSYFTGVEVHKVDIIVSGVVP